MLLSGHARPAAALAACPTRRPTDQREDTVRVSRKQGSDRAGQDFPILAGRDANRLTVVTVSNGSDRGRWSEFSHPVGIDQGDVVRATVGVNRLRFCTAPMFVPAPAVILDSSSRRNGVTYVVFSKAVIRSAGVSQSRILRGRALSSSAIAARS